MKTANEIREMMIEEKERAIIKKIEESSLYGETSLIVDSSNTFTSQFRQRLISKGYKIFNNGIQYRISWEFEDE